MEKQQSTRRVSFFPTSYRSSQAVSVPGHCALPVLWSLHSYQKLQEPSWAALGPGL